MKIIHSGVKEKFTIESNNYHPVYTFLVFNFLTSPRLQEIYQIDQSHKEILDLNRLLRVKIIFDNVRIFVLMFNSNQAKNLASIMF